MQNGMLNGTVKQNGIFQRHHSHPEQPYMWHAKSYDNGLGKSDFKIFDYLMKSSFTGDADFDAPYQIYGRLSTPSRGYVPVVPRMGYVGDWE